jgi:uncharacterized membrane protein (GlpM family)
MAVTACLGVVAGGAWGLLDRRISPSPAAMRIANAAALGALLVVTLVGTAVAARNDPADRVRVAWSEFTTNETEREGGSRLGSLDSQRWDHWRVGLDRFAAHPIRGIGAEQFNVDYLRERRTFVDARYVHSFPIGVLSQLGLVGALLFGTFAVLATVLVRPRRADEPLARTIRLGVFGLWVYWLVHASVDWFYEIPAVTAPVFAFLGLALALRPSGSTAPPTTSRAPLAVGIAACAAGAVALVPPYLAARDVRSAVAVWPVDSASAFDRLDRARRLDPLSDEPDLYAGAIATRLDEPARMRLHFARVLERNEFNWYARLQLGLTYSVLGRRQAAVREVRRARDLNPFDPVLADVLEQLESGETVAPREVDRLFVERTLRRLR